MTITDTEPEKRVLHCNKCHHFRVCKLYGPVHDAFSPFIKPQFGGRNPMWDKVYDLIADVCQFYEEEDEMY